MTIEFIISNNLDFNNNFGPLNNPLAIIYGYIGCTKAMMLGYSRVWLERGFNVLIYYPSSILSFYRKGVVQINNKIIKYFNDNPYSTKVLAFHSISSGANCLSYHLKLLYHKYPFLLPLIKACCFDNISTFRNSILNFNQSLKSSGNILNFLHSLILPLFLPLWSIHEKNDFKYLISKNNKFHYLVIYNNTNIDNTSKLFIKTLKQKGNQFNEKNSDSDLILIEKVIQNNQLYYESTNQLIDLVTNNNNNNRNIRHIYSKNTLFCFNINTSNGLECNGVLCKEKVCTIPTSCGSNGEECIYSQRNCTNDNDHKCSVVTCNNSDYCESCFSKGNCLSSDKCGCVTINKNVCDDGNVCTTDTCDSTGCINFPKCDTSNKCLSTTCNNVTGDCDSKPIICNDNVQCTDDMCDIHKGCNPIPNHGKCNDNDKCTMDKCTPTGCINVPIVCKPARLVSGLFGVGFLCFPRICDINTGFCVNNGNSPLPSFIC